MGNFEERLQNMEEGFSTVLAQIGNAQEFLLAEKRKDEWIQMVKMCEMQAWALGELESIMSEKKMQPPNRTIP